MEALVGDIADGQSVEVQGSGSNTYILSNTGGVYQCTCPVWKYQRLPVDLRTCKHLRAYRGDAEESTRTRNASPGSRNVAGTGTRSAGGGTLPKSATAPKLLLAHRWSNDIDIEGWWMSEKLDGVRAFWDGERFWSRQGNEFLAPDWFIQEMPTMPMDGELFAGRGKFQDCVSIVRRQDRSDDWKRVEFLVFDAPMEHAIFEQRIQTIEAVLAASDCPYVKIVSHEMCDGLDDLEIELDRVEAIGAEGLMLRQPNSPYQAGRSYTLLKVKSFHDAEARVVGHQDGTGRHLGRMGALLMELPNGVRFKIGTGFSDVQRDSPLPLGAVVTFRFQELTNAGVPRFPSFISERIDLAWEHCEAPPRRASPLDGATGTTRTLPTPPLGDTPIVLMAKAPASAPRAAPVRAPEPPPSIDSEGNVYLEFTKGATVRYWEVEWVDQVVHIEYGRVDKTPKTDRTEFPLAIDAARWVEKQISAKREKGYVDEI